MNLSLAFSDPEEERRLLRFNRREQRDQFWKLVIVGLIVTWSMAWQDEIISTVYGYIATDVRLYAITPVSLVAIWALLYEWIRDRMPEPLMAISDADERRPRAATK